VPPAPTPPPMPKPVYTPPPMPKPFYTPQPAYIPPKPVSMPPSVTPNPTPVGTGYIPSTTPKLVMGGVAFGVLILIIALVGILSNQENVPSVAENNTATATDRAELPATSTLEPTDLPTATNTNLSTATNTDLPTATNTPQPTATITAEIGFTPITQNEDWTPQEQEFDGVTMVLVPAGCFMMGSTTGNSDEAPVHEQCFDTPFWIDTYEVTQAQFAEFGGQKANANSFTGDELPVELITWFEARDYCELRSGRLPTEREWEYAARGPNNLTYPWGNQVDGTRLNFCDENCQYDWRDATVDDGYATTAPVGSYPQGVSWVGAMDMSGNVWEWVSSFYGAYPYDETDESVSDNTSLRVLRGGSWFNNLSNVRSVNRNWYIPTDGDSGVGLRCVRSQE